MWDARSNRIENATMDSAWNLRHLARTLSTLIILYSDIWYCVSQLCKTYKAFCLTLVTSQQSHRQLVINQTSAFQSIWAQCPSNVWHLQWCYWKSRQHYEVHDCSREIENITSACIFAPPLHSDMYPIIFWELVRWYISYYLIAASPLSIFHLGEDISPSFLSTGP